MRDNVQVSLFASYLWDYDGGAEYTAAPTLFANGSRPHTSYTAVLYRPLQSGD